MALLDDIGTKTRALLDSQNARNTADDTANRASDNRANGASSPVPVASTLLDAAWDALRMGRNGCSKSGKQRRRTDKTVHIFLQIVWMKMRYKSARGE
jgi:hypothetical protein